MPKPFSSMRLRSAGAIALCAGLWLEALRLALERPVAHAAGYAVKEVAVFSFAQAALAGAAALFLAYRWSRRQSLRWPAGVAIVPALTHLLAWRVVPGFWPDEPLVACFVLAEPLAFWLMVLGIAILLADHSSQAAPPSPEPPV